MIRPEMARKFIDQITEYTEYNINIMDESGGRIGCDHCQP